MFIHYIMISKNLIIAKLVDKPERLRVLESEAAKTNANNSRLDKYYFSNRLLLRVDGPLFFIS